MEKEYIKCAMCHQDIQPNAIGWAEGQDRINKLMGGKKCG